MTSRKYKILGHVGALAAALSLQACAPGDGADERVQGTVVLVDRTTNSLSAGAIYAINGTYGADCLGRDTNGTDRWSVAVSSGATLSHSSVTVVDTDDCTLTLTEVVTNVGSMPGTAVVHTAVPPITLAGAYASPASTFRPANAPTTDPATFYANAKMPDGWTGVFTADFAITLAFSEDPSFRDILIPGTLAPQRVATVTRTSVDSPDYTLTDDLAFTANNGALVNLSGAATLVPGEVPGEGYALVAASAPLANDFATLDQAFNANVVGGVTPTAVPASFTANQLRASIDAASLTTLPAVVSLIIVNIDATTQVKTYQLITFTLAAPVVVTCNAPAVLSNNQCTCPLPNLEVSGICTAPETCTGAAVLVGLVCQCQPPNVQTGGGACVVPPTCNGGTVVNGLCECTPPFTNISGTCTLPVTCNGGTVVSGVCVCMPPFIDISGTCTLPVQCIGGTVINNVCMCSPLFINIGGFCMFIGIP